MSLYQKLLKYRIVPILYFVIFLGIIGFAIDWFLHAGLGSLLHDPNALIAYIESYGAKAYAIVFALQLFGVIFIPATGGIIVVASAMLFGFGPTMLICTLATVLGSCISFALARYLGRPLLELFLNKHKLDKYIKSFEERKNLLLFIMFFFPFFPDDILCYVAGLVNIKWKYFILAAALGRPWGLALNCLVGISVFAIPSWSYVSSALFVIVLFALSWRYGPIMEKKIIAKVNQRKEHHHTKKTPLSQEH